MSIIFHFFFLLFPVIRLVWFGLVGWLVGWFIGWLVGWLVG